MKRGGEGEGEEGTRENSNGLLRADWWRSSPGNLHSLLHHHPHLQRPELPSWSLDQTHRAGTSLPRTEFIVKSVSALSETNNPVSHFSVPSSQGVLLLRKSYPAYSCC